MARVRIYQGLRFSSRKRVHKSYRRWQGYYAKWLPRYLKFLTGRSS